MRVIGFSATLERLEYTPLTRSIIGHHLGHLLEIAVIFTAISMIFHWQNAYDNCRR